MVFLTIEPGDDLTSAQRRRVGRIGPPSVLVRTSYPSLLRTAGLVDITVVDLHDEYRATQRSRLDETVRHSEDLIALIGAEEYEEARRGRRRTLDAIEDGLLTRRLYVAGRP